MLRLIRGTVIPLEKMDSFLVSFLYTSSMLRGAFPLFFNFFVYLKKKKKKKKEECKKIE
jgi:hypothetical protein